MSDTESPGLATVIEVSRPISTATGANAEPTVAELERGILDAVKLGLADVAKTLAGQLEQRKRPVMSNVVKLESRRGRKG